MDKLKLIFVMLIWGSIGVFTKYIDISPILLSFLRALTAIPVLYIFFRIENKSKFRNVLSIQKARPFIIGGAIMGIAWVCLFMAFKNTSISIAVLVYNMCPVYVLILSPVILQEKLNPVQAICVLVAFIGLGLIVCNAINGVDFNISGLLFGIMSGVLYASLVLLNRKVKTNYTSTTITLIQMISACLILIPFVIFDGGIPFGTFDVKTNIMVLILGVIHTGFAYFLYFSTYKTMKATSIVAISYLEPVFSIFLSATVLSEVLSANQIIGGALILLSTFLGEMYKPRA